MKYLCAFLLFVSLAAAQTWQQVVPSGNWQAGTWPSARGWNKGIADGHGNVFYYGAITPCGDPFSNAIWAYNVSPNIFSNLWTSGSGQVVNGACVPPKSIQTEGNGIMPDRHPEGATAIDTKRNQLHQMGGITVSMKYVDNFHLDLVTLQLTRDADNPTAMGALEEGCMAYDQLNDIMVHFGGERNGGANSETWVKNLTTNTWAKVATTGAPSIRIRTRCFFDTIRQKVMVFSGTNGGGTWYNDLYEFDYANAHWNNLHPTGTPPPLGTHWLTIAHDPVLGVDFSYVGTNQTFIYNPSLNNWSQSVAQGGPPAPTPVITDAMSLEVEPVTHTLVLEYPTTNDNNQIIWTLSRPTSRHK